MDRNQAAQLLQEWVASPGLIRHSLAVEQVMRCAARKYGTAADEPDRWGLAGLLHDADWERWPEEHPHRVVQHLREQGEEEIAHAIAAHGVKWGVPHTTPMSRALVASDELTGLVVACSLLRPDGITTLDVAGVLKKFKNPKFAAGVDRAEVTEGVRILGIALDEHVSFILTALRENAVDLGLALR